MWAAAADDDDDDDGVVGGGRACSDVDMGVVGAGKNPIFALAAVFRRQGRYHNIETIAKARVPIIKLVDSGIMSACAWPIPTTLAQWSPMALVSIPIILMISSSSSCSFSKKPTAR